MVPKGGGGGILSELLSNFSWRKLNIKSPADVWRTEFRARQSMNATYWVVLAKKWQSIVGQALDFEHEVASSYVLKIGNVLAYMLLVSSSQGKKQATNTVCEGNLK